MVNIAMNTSLQCFKVYWNADKQADPGYGIILVDYSFKAELFNPFKSMRQVNDFVSSHLTHCQDRSGSGSDLLDE